MAGRHLAGFSGSGLGHFRDARRQGSPDGGAIVFATNDGAEGTFADIFILDLASGRRTQVTRTPNLDGWPSWGRNS